MALPAAPRPQRRHSLSVRLLVLVVSILLLVELLFYIPGIQRERWRFLQERLNDCQLVVLAVGASNNGMPPAAERQQIERLTDAEMIRLLSPPGPRDVLTPLHPLAASSVIDLDHERWTEGLFGALAALVPAGPQRLEVIGTSITGGRLQLLIPVRALTGFLRGYTARFAFLTLTIAAIVGALLFISLRAILVVPLGRMARNIAAFRADPERAIPLDADQVSALSGDEVSIVARELAAMQAGLRTTLWRNARLAAVGTAVAKMSHDLRGILSSALLVADRLTMSRDEQVRQAGEVIVRAVHRATGLAQHTLDFVREGPPPLTRSRVVLHDLVEEASALLTGEQGRACTVRNELPAASEANVDRDGLLRVLTNLFRNAAQAGARTITVAGMADELPQLLTVSDDGPGLPPNVQDRLFRPFSPSGSGGTGLGLAIARDLMWAHGGDLRLASTSPAGTSFALYLQQPKREDD